MIGGAGPKPNEKDLKKMTSSKYAQLIAKLRTEIESLRDKINEDK